MSNAQSSTQLNKANSKELTKEAIEAIRDSLVILARDHDLPRSFYASQVIPRGSGIGAAQVVPYLGFLVEQGDLDVRFEVLCPETNEVLATYRLEEQIPLDQEVEDAEGGKFVLRSEHVVVEYFFTPQFSVRRLLGLPDGKLYRAWWKARYLATAIFIGYPRVFARAVKQGLASFARAFGSEWGERWKIADSDEAYRRFINVH